MRVESVEGFVLHARDYRDTSQLVDIFTSSFGRMRLVARGSRSHKKNALRLSPFCLAEFSWTGKGELKTLTGFEIRQTYQLTGKNLISGFYINELLWHLLQPEDSHPQLYQLYAQSLRALDTEIDLESLLRSFELNLLEEVGYGISFEYDSNGTAIDSDKYYSLLGDIGWQIVDEQSSANAVTGASSGPIKGLQLRAIAERDFSSPASRKVCKHLSRKAIDELLEGRKLHSRDLIKALYTQ